MNSLSRGLLLISLTLCFAAEAQSLPGRLPGTLPGQQPPAAPKPPAPSPAPAADIPAACCDITAIDKATGVVSARERVGGRIVEFKAASPALLQNLRVGQAVHANFNTRQVSVDGKTMCCAIASVAAPPAVAAKTPAQSPPPAQKAPQTAPAQPQPAPAQPQPAQAHLPQKPSQAQPPQQPSRIAAADAPKTLGAPQALPGRPPVQAPAAAPAQPKIAQGPLPSRAPQAEPPKTSGPPARAAEPLRDVKSTARVTRKTYQMPTVTFGTPEPRSAKDRGRQHASIRGGAHLRGLDEIEGSGLPEAAKIVMMMHAGTLPENVSDHYIVNTAMAVEWAKTHKVPSEMKPKKKKKKKKKCDWTHSGGCADKVKKTVQDVWDSASEDWKRAWKANTKNLQESWDEVEECFHDHTLRVSDIPVKFKLPVQFPAIGLEKSSSGNSSSGSAKGTLSVALPVEADFRAQVELFYIPCLPFAIRPKSVGADGNMAITAKFGAQVTAAGAFHADYMIPPGGGPAIPVAVIPIVVGGIPVATLDVSLYVDGTVRVGGEGQLDGRFNLVAPFKNDFDFECNGRGCRGRMRNVPVPTTATENVVLKGSVHVQPAIYTALQLSLNFDALSARAGPQPFLYGEVRGCSATAAMQNTSGQSTAQEFHALSADLDWGMEFRAEALVAGEQVEAYVQEVMKRKHIWFGDIAPGGSTAMSPGITGPGQLAVGSAGEYRFKSRPCHPYTDAVDYRVTWAGGATATSGPPQGARKVSLQEGKSSSSTACTWGAGQGTCTLKPGAAASFHLAWPQAGAHAVTVTPLRDKHGREFKPDRATQVNVNVQ